MLTKKYIIQGSGWLGHSDITWGQANSTGVPPKQTKLKLEDLTNLSTNIEQIYSKKLYGIDPLGPVSLSVL